jgi:hypothetical protein
MAIEFPSSPVEGDVYTYGSQTWRYDGTIWLIVHEVVDIQATIEAYLAQNTLDEVITAPLALALPDGLDPDVDTLPSSAARYLPTVPFPVIIFVEEDVEGTLLCTYLRMYTLTVTGADDAASGAFSDGVDLLVPENLLKQVLAGIEMGGAAGPWERVIYSNGVNILAVKRVYVDDTARSSASAAASSASTAGTAAATAQSAAEGAQSAAEGAQSAAAAAGTAASTAQAAAADAQSTADTAVTAAGTAQSTADAATTTANDAASAIGGVSDTVSTLSDSVTAHVNMGELNGVEAVIGMEGTDPGLSDDPLNGVTVPAGKAVILYGCADSANNGLWIVGGPGDPLTRPASGDYLHAPSGQHVKVTGHPGFYTGLILSGFDSAMYRYDYDGTPANASVAAFTLGVIV